MLIIHRRKRELIEVHIISGLYNRALISCTAVHYLNYHFLALINQLLLDRP